MMAFRISKIGGQHLPPTFQRARLLLMNGTFLQSEMYQVPSSLSAQLIKSSLITKRPWSIKRIGKGHNQVSKPALRKGVLNFTLKMCKEFQNIFFSLMKCLTPEETCLLFLVYRYFIIRNKIHSCTSKYLILPRMDCCCSPIFSPRLL